MELKPGYKLTEVGVIPEDWEATRLREICSMKSGESITGADIDRSSQYPCYGGNGLRGFTKRYTHDGCYSLIGRQGALCGNVIGAAGKFFASEHAIVVTALASTDIRWLTVVLGKMRLNQYSESSAQPGLSVSKLLDLVVVRPPTDTEQKAIAEALSDADALIESLDQLIAKKRQIKQGAMQELLTGKRRLPGFSGEWMARPLGEICSMKSGFSITSEAIDEHSSFPCYGGNGLRGFTATYTHDGRYGLIGRQGALCGNVVRVEGQFFASEHAIVVTPKSTIDIDWLTFVLRRMNLNQYSESSAQPGLSVSKLKALECDVPPYEEQAAIAAILSDMDTELAALESRLAKARQIKQGMMQELLTGRIRLL